jgi:hypothetical protein
VQDEIRSATQNAFPVLAKNESRRTLGTVEKPRRFFTPRHFRLEDAGAALSFTLIATTV